MSEPIVHIKRVSGGFVLEEWSTNRTVIAHDLKEALEVTRELFLTADTEKKKLDAKRELNRLQGGL